MEIGPSLIYVSCPTYGLAPVFSLPSAALQAVRQLGSACKNHDIALVAYVIAPAGLRALVAPRQKADLQEFLYNYRWLSTRALIGLELGDFEVRLLRGGRFKVWMRRFDHLVISSRSQMESRMTYIHELPVNAGLAGRPEDYEYSSAGDWLRNEPGIIPIEKNLDWLNLL